MYSPEAFCCFPLLRERVGMTWDLLCGLYDGLPYFTAGDRGMFVLLGYLAGWPTREQWLRCILQPVWLSETLTDHSTICPSTKRGQKTVAVLLSSPSLLGLSDCSLHTLFTTNYTSTNYQYQLCLHLLYVESVKAIMTQSEELKFWHKDLKSSLIS